MPPYAVRAQQQRGLIETLHTVQEAFGYLDEQALRYVAMSLRVPLSRAYGVATFYHFFTLKPAGEHTCVICMGTACYIKGSQQLLDAVQHDLGIRSGRNDRRQESFAAHGALPGIVRPGAGGGLRPGSCRQGGDRGHPRTSEEMDSRMTPEELDQIAETEREAQSHIHRSA